MLSAPPLLRFRREVHRYLRALLSGQEPPLLGRMVRYHLGWEDAEGRPVEAGGKALRPSLCLLACEAVGRDWRRALPAAAAVELVHNFSLIHDDIQDRDLERHHRPALWAVWGEAQAINAGDALLALARLSLLKLAGAGAAAGTVVGAARLLDERTLEMVEGQTLDIAYEERLDVDVAAYIEMVEKKSGALFDCALGLGALVAGADAALVERMGRVGRALGAAFQVRDDMLGIWGDESKTGKPLGADIRRRKKSLPIVFALSEAQGATRDRLRGVYSQTVLSDSDVALVLGCLDEAAAREYCARFATERRDIALRELSDLDLVPGPANELRETAAFLLEREF